MMNKYTKPEIKIEKLDISDVITTSSTVETTSLDTWGTNVKTVDAGDIELANIHEE